MSTEKISAEIKSNLLISSYQIGSEVKNIIGKTFTAVVDKLPKNVDQYIVFNLGEVEFNDAKSNVQKEIEDSTNDKPQTK